ncbi:MAG TPA: VOC family protein [Candidatus Binataceae bacterium]|nr:VOC family protein [Candidatus Binataceae bacterium]
MQLNPYLTFNGNCADAFKSYEKTLGGKIVMMMTHAESPAADQVPANWRDKIIHARMTVGDEVLMGSDAPPDRFVPMKGICVSLSVDAPADAERIFSALAANGSVQMPLQRTFLASRFGMLIDRFGTPWMINCEGAGQ